MATVVRTDHVGSLIRPEKLLDARDAYKAGRISRDELTAAEDSSILDALELQRHAGIDVFTDGEMRRDAYTTDLYDSVEGFEEDYPVVEQTKPDGTKVLIEMHTKAVTGKLRQFRRLAAHEAAFLKQHCSGTYKITLPTPVRGRPQNQERIPPPYSSWEEIQQDIVDIFRDEMLALAGEGVTYIQLDKVPTPYLTEESREAMRQRGIDPEKALEAEIAWENSCFDAVRSQFPNVTLALHLCRGNRVGWLGGVGGYDLVAEKYFNGYHVDRFLLEFDTVRAGGFEPLSAMPAGKIAMLGLVSTKTNQIERQDDLLRRIDEASKFCPLDQLAIGPQCGFQSSASRDGPSMTIDDERRKLELLVDTAKKVWA